MEIFKDKVIDYCAKGQHQLITDMYIQSDGYQKRVDREYREEKEGVKAAQKKFLMGSREKRQRVVEEIEKIVKKEMGEAAKKQAIELYQKEKMDDDVPRIHFE